MNPTKAVQALLARDLTEAAIGKLAGIAQASVNRIKCGAMPAWDVGQRLIALAAKQNGKQRRG